MYINIDGVLQSKGKTRYWLSKIIGCNYQSLCRLCNNKSSGISFKLLHDICIALECGVEEVLVVGED